MPRENRLLSLLLCSSLLFSLCSPPVFAQEQSGGQVPGASGLENQSGPGSGCICTEPCAERAIRADCPVCSVDLSACTGQKAPERDVSLEGVQAMIDALPEGEKITGDNAAEVRAQLEAIDAAKARLSDEEIGRLDISLYKAAAAALAGMAGNALPAASGTLTIGDVSVTDTTDDVLGDGTAAYDKDTHTLTLSNCQLPGREINFSGDSDATLTIRLTGENQFKLINITSDLTITGDGSLVVKNDSYKGIYITSAAGCLTISEGAHVTANANEGGIDAPGNIKISGSTVTATSNTGNGIYSGQGNVEISGSTVTATSDANCGISAYAGTIQIDSSTVNTEGYSSGLNGNTGVTITEGSEVKAVSSADCGIFSPADIAISGSKLTAQSPYPAIFSLANIGVSGSEVEATSESAAGICSQNESITISGSEVTAEGYYFGLQKNGESGGVSITGSKVTATATVPIEDYDGSGIYTQGDFSADASEVYAEGSYLGIYIAGAGTANGAWIRAENDIGMDGGNYQPEDSVTIQSGEWWVAGDAKVPAGALIKQGDRISIPENASLYLEEGETTILGGANGITIDSEGALLLPVGTVIQRKDGTRQAIGAGGGKISLDGDVSTTYSVTLHLGGGTIASGKEIAEYNYGTGALLPAAGDMAYAGFRFGGWYADAGFSGSQVTAITPTDWGDKDYYAKWERETGITTAGSENDGSSENDDSFAQEEDDAYRFWQQVERQIKGAKADATIRINARDYRRMPLFVMKVLRSRKDVSLVIRWNGGKTITIPAGKAPWEERRAYYPLSYLESYDFGLAAAGDAAPSGKENPGTGAPDIAG